MPSSVLSLKKASVSRKGRVILSSVDLTLQKGQLTTLIGPNGAGKSTLLKVLVQLIPLSEGEFFIKPGLMIGYMPQKLMLNEMMPLTVEKFLSLGNKRPSQDLDKILEEVGASSLKKYSIHTLSGGEFQRILLARALLRNPDFLILDEPVQGVDIVGQIELYQLIDTIRKERGCGVLLVSHDLHLVMRSSDHVVCLNTHICCAGHPDVIQKDPHYKALFGGLSVLAPYSHHHDHRHDHCHDPGSPL